MGIFSSINPFGFAGKESCAWNALQAANLFQFMDEEDRQEVRDLAIQIYRRVTRLDTSYSRLLSSLGVIGLYALYSLAMQELGYKARVRHARKGEGWLELRKPFTQCQGAQDHVQRLTVELERSSGEILPDLLSGFDPYPPGIRDAHPRITHSESESSVLAETGTAETQPVSPSQPSMVRVAKIFQYMQVPFLEDDIGIMAAGGFHTFLKAGSKMPCSIFQRFSTAVDGQNFVSLRLLRRPTDGKGTLKALRTITMSGFVAGPRGTPAIDLELRAARDFHLYAYATDGSNGSALRITLDGPNP